MTAGPLTGVRVLELAGLGPAPFAATLLADLGADVLRLDRPPAGGERAAGDLLTRGRRSVGIDLRAPGAAGVVLELVGGADVLIEGFRPGVAERLGVGPQACLAANPRLVYGRMTGWGQDGPAARTAAHDINFLAVTGVLSAIGRHGGPPQVPLNLLGDFGAGGLYLVVGVLAALLERDRSGQGQVVDAAIVDGLAHLSTMVHGMLAAGSWQDERGVNAFDTGRPWYDVYEAADGRYVAVGAYEDAFYDQFVGVILDELRTVEDLDPDLKGLDRNDFRRVPGREEELRTTLGRVLRTRTQAEWTAAFEGTDACVTPVLSWSQARRHPHLVARGTFVTQHGVAQPAPAPRFSRTAASLGAAAPAPGEHTRDALSDWGVADPQALLDLGIVFEG